MTLDKLIKIYYDILKKWLDKKPNGKIVLEVHATEGHIAKVYRDHREEITDDILNEQ